MRVAFVHYGWHVVGSRYMVELVVTKHALFDFTVPSIRVCVCV